MFVKEIHTLSREQLFLDLYQKAFPAVARFIHKMGGTLDETKDIFQDSLVIYCEKKADEGFSPQTNEVAYIVGIAKHLWYKKHKENRSPLSLELVSEQKIKTEEEPKISNEIFRYIEASGKKCLDLLTSFYYDKLKMKEIADRFGFSGERSATAQKFKCLEKVRNAVRERSLKKSDFYE
jgi:DNA-directed RNA polymerase specialized sigma24 family protein